MTELASDAASAQITGRRDRQEDAVIVQFPQDGGPGFAVLSDGMGGHDDGDLASRILVSEMFGELFLSAARDSPSETPAANLFRSALDSANRRLGQHIQAGWLSADTGGTLLTVSIRDDRLHWLSVGDSPLYLYRSGRLHRLNENHSMAAQLDLMVRNGALDATAARNHPHRHCLTSAVTGEAVPRIDCPDSPVTLAPGDVIVLASDGLNVLTGAEARAVIGRHAVRGSAGIARALLRAVEEKNERHQDNTSVAVISLRGADEASRVPSHGILGKTSALFAEAVTGSKDIALQALRAVMRGARL